MRFFERLVEIAEFLVKLLSGIETLAVLYLMARIGVVAFERFDQPAFAIERS